MKIDNILLDNLTSQAKESPRLRMNLDLRDPHVASLLGLPEGAVPAMLVEKGQWHRLESLESRTVIGEFKNGGYVPIGEKDILIK